MTKQTPNETTIAQKKEDSDVLEFISFFFFFVYIFFCIFKHTIHVWKTTIFCDLFTENKFKI